MERICIPIITVVKYLLHQCRCIRQYICQSRTSDGLSVLDRDLCLSIILEYHSKSFKWLGTYSNSTCDIRSLRLLYMSSLLIPCSIVEALIRLNTIICRGLRPFTEPLLSVTPTIEFAGKPVAKVELLVSTFSCKISK